MSGALVAIAAHADDAEINAGGLMAKWAAGGGAVHILMMTDNGAGAVLPADGDETRKYRLPPEENSRLRHREQQAAADLIGARVHHVGYLQRTYWDGERVRRIGYDPAPPAPPGFAGRPCILLACGDAALIAELGARVAALRPALVVTQTPLDVDPEHHAVAAMAWLAFQRTPALAGVPLLFWAGSTSSPGGLADPRYDRIEDISGYYETKRRLCAAHASQWTARRQHIVRARAEHWGRTIGVAHAEPFRSAWWADETAGA